MWAEWAFGCMYIWLGLPHVTKCPANLLRTYVRLRCEHAAGCDGVSGCWELAGMTAAQRAPVAHLIGA